MSDTTTLGYDEADQQLEQADLEAKYGAAGHPVYTAAKYAEALSKHPEIETNFNGYYDWVSFMCLSDLRFGQNANPEEVVDITDINQFAAMVSHWHQNMLARLRNLRDIPFGTEVVLIDDATGKEIKTKLKGDAMKGFQTALNAAIAELSKFPFVATVEDAPAANDAAPDQ